jgi:hypothetical protein
MLKFTTIRKIKMNCSPHGLRSAIALAVLALSCTVASATDYYIAQSVAGSGDASSCANAKASSWNWASPSVADGDTVHVCGAITSALIIPKGGTTTAITLQFMSGAQFSSPAWVAAIQAYGLSHLIIDGGANGLIQNTANGDGLANQSASYGVYLSLCTNVEVKNLTISNLYVHVRGTPSSPMVYGVFDTGGTGISIHNNTIHDAYYGIFRAASYSGSNLNWFANTIYNCNWGFGVTAGGVGIVLDTVNVHNNDVTMGTIWDDTGNGNHHNGIYAYTDPTPNARITNLSFYNNYVHGAIGQQWTSTAMFFASYGVISPKIYNNSFVGNSGDPATGYIVLDSNALSSTPLVANNTIIGTSVVPYLNTWMGANIYPRCLEVDNSPLSAVTFENNICATVYNGMATDIVIASDYNDIWNVTDYGVISGTYYTAWPGVGSWQAAGYDTHGTNGNPLLSSSYELQPGSPAIGAGANLYTVCNGQPNPGLGALCSDLSGNPRPSSGAWDAGAFSFNSAPNPPNPPAGLTTLVH